MSKQRRVHYTLKDTRNVERPSDCDIEHILRAADSIIDKSGRAMLVKILRGSKDKKLLEYGLDKCPSYGYYSNLKMDEIQLIVDWMIVNDYLRITYNGKLPMIMFSYMGWELYKPVYMRELIGQIKLLKEEDMDQYFEKLKFTNREVIELILDTIMEDMMIELKEFLIQWKPNAFKKVAKKIGFVLRCLEEHKL